MLNFEKLLNQIDSVTKQKKNYASDEERGYWRQSKDKDGNATSIIRFLPDRDPDELPFAKIFTYSFKNPDTNRWYIESSPSTIGLPDPIMELNSAMYNSGVESQKAIAKSRSRKLSYIANILVVKDGTNPDNDGKVFKFKFGQKIFDKLMARMRPSAEEIEMGEEPVNIFDPETGADFILKQKVVANFPNYDDSKFGQPKPIAKTKEAIDAILSKCYSVKAEVAEDQFKSYSELKSKLDWVLGHDAKKAAAPTKSSYEHDLEEIESAVKTAPEKPSKSKPAPVIEDASEDDDAEFFKSLMND